MTLRIAFGRSLRPGASRYLTCVIFGDFELSAVPWQRSGASFPSSVRAPRGGAAGASGGCREARGSARIESDSRANQFSDFFRDLKILIFFAKNLEKIGISKIFEIFENLDFLEIFREKFSDF